MRKRMLSENNAKDFIGGHAEIHNTCRRYVRRGKIKSIDFSGGRIIVRFSRAIRRAEDSTPRKWVEDTDLEYRMNHSYTSGPSGGGVVLMNSRTHSEHTFFFRADHETFKLHDEEDLEADDEEETESVAA